MADLLSSIGVPVISGLLGGLFGGNGLQDDFRSILQNTAKEGWDYRKDAYGGFQNQQQQGNDNYNFYKTQLPGLYNTYGAAAGLSGFNLPASSVLNTLHQPANATVPGAGQTQNTIPSAQNIGRQRQPNSAAGTGQTPEQQQAQAQQAIYGLTPAQLQQLNQQVDNVNAAMQNALSDYRAKAAQQGLAVNPAAEAMIREKFQGQAAQLKSNFAEQARANRQQAAQSLLNYVTGIGQWGGQQQLAGTQGIANLSNQAAAWANPSAAIASQQNAQQQQGSMGQLVAYLIQSALNGAPKAPVIGGSVNGGNYTQQQLGANNVGANELFGGNALNNFLAALGGLGGI